MILIATLIVSLGWFVVGLLAADWFAWYRRVKRDRSARRIARIGAYSR